VADSEYITIEVRPAEGGIRLDKLLADRIPELSGRSAVRLIEKGAVRIAGKPTRKGAHLAVGDVIEVARDVVTLSTPEFEPEAAPSVAVTVLHRDARTLVVDKPAGMHCAPLRPGDTTTLVNGVASLAPQTTSVKGFHNREGGLVHRIDALTSGVCLFALDQDAFDRLRTASETDLVVKDYLAVVSGRFLDGPPILEAEIPHQGGRGKRVRVKAVRRLRSRVLAPRQSSDGHRLVRMRVDVVKRKATRSLVRVKLTRGFRHQIRAVLEAVGHPVIGDPLYCPGDDHPELLLHSTCIVFPHPDDGHLVKVESPAYRITRAFV
jgi:23S rRNA pseudouridine1911/1915/1917 synthase